MTSKMHNRNKMKKTNSKAIKWLKREGFITYTVPHGRFSKDAFGIADCIAIKDGEMFLVQFRTNAWGDMKIHEDFFMKHQNLMLKMV